MTSLRLAVCDTPARLEPGSEPWERLCEAVRRADPDLLLLPEMPFGPWIASAKDPDPAALGGSRRAHDAAIERFGELGAPLILATRPVPGEGGRGLNEAFCWSREEGRDTLPRKRVDPTMTFGRLRGSVLPFHTKQYFPDEEGYWEARWFLPGTLRFRATTVSVSGRSLRVGALICTDLWFNEWARDYGRQEADLLVVPRATPPETTDRWQTAVRMAALVSGCWVASANRSGADEVTGQAFGGAGWIFDPDGELVAETGPETPVALAELDLSLSTRAKREYPRYVGERP